MCVRVDPETECLVVHEKGSSSSKRRGKSVVRFSLSPDEITQIDRAICQVGQFGRVGLVIEGGRIRFIEVTSSHNVLPPSRMD